MRATTFITALLLILSSSILGQTNRFIEKFQKQELCYSEISASIGPGNFTDVRATAFRISDYSHYAPGIVLQTERYADNISGMIHTRASPLGITLDHNRGPGTLTTSLTVGFMQTGQKQEVSPSVGVSFMLLSPRVVMFVETGIMTANKSMYVDAWARFKAIRTSKNLFWDIGVSTTTNRFIGSRVGFDITCGYRNFGIKLSAGSAFGQLIPSGDGPDKRSGHQMIGTIGVVVSSF